jgi:hypothetical protein
VVAGTRARYIEAFEGLTEIPSTATSTTRRSSSDESDRARSAEAGILDPQGEAVLGSLKQLGFAVDDARVGRVVDLELQTATASRRAPTSNACASSYSRTR